MDCGRVQGFPAALVCPNLQEVEDGKVFLWKWKELEINLRVGEAAQADECPLHLL